MARFHVFIPDDDIVPLPGESREDALRRAITGRVLRESKRNAFLAMCDLAHTDQWCWRIGCATCTCCHFRNGLGLLANGLHPDSPQWARIANDRRLRTKPVPLVFDEQATVLGIVSKVEIADLQETCHSPDYLAYLGLVLHETREAEQATGLLTRTLLPKLLELIDDVFVREDLEVRFADGRLLRWQDLEAFEEPLRPPWRSMTAK